MTRPTDAARSAVRRALQAEPERPGRLALVACSGGPDSLALAAATAQAAAQLGWRAGAVIVDHGLQQGSDAVAARAAEQCAQQHLEPVLLRTVVVAGRAGGPEAAARAARYEAFADAARDRDAAVLLLGHTLDDQAETVLLGLARGSGARSLQGMPRRSPLPGASTTVVLRPLLDLTRATVLAACRAWQLQPWADPHNDDPGYTRVRVRVGVMPALAAALGPGVPQALARTADQLRDDEAALSDLAAAALLPLGDSPACRDLLRQPPAVRRRMLRQLLLTAGCPPADLNSGHLQSLDQLLAARRDGGDVRLPGGVNGHVRCGRLVLAAAPVGPQELSQ